MKIKARSKKYNRKARCFSCGRPSNTAMRVNHDILTFCRFCNKFKARAKEKGIGVALSTKTWSKGVWKDYSRINPLRSV